MGRKKSFNAYGVPWYSRSDTPAIRRSLPKEFEDLPEDYKKSRANQMKARIYVVQWIKENWKPGDRFLLKYSTDGYDINEEKHNYTIYTGEFIECKLAGQFYFVYTKLDEGQKGPSGPRFGAFSFYHWAVKL